MICTGLYAKKNSFTKFKGESISIIFRDRFYKYEIRSAIFHYKLLEPITSFPYKYIRVFIGATSRASIFIVGLVLVSYSKISKYNVDRILPIVEKSGPHYNKSKFRFYHS